jgi:NAD(P)-dependent dehydrogenase (short-subunit alcohol dehydrogenase family)
MAMELEEHVAVVTGGSSGIGFAIAAALGSAGARVAIWGRSTAKLEQAEQALVLKGVDVVTCSCDVSDPEAVQRATDETVDAFGSIDSCFANAAAAGLGVPFLDVTPAQLRGMLDVNLAGAYYTVQIVARRMVRQGTGGSLVAVSSLAGVQGAALQVPYSAAKAGVLAMMRSCAVELARYGIRANTILPGWIDTPMTDGLLRRDPMHERVLPRIPARRWGSPEDFGGIAVYLASNASSYHTGDEITVDGGYRVF